MSEGAFRYRPGDVVRVRTGPPEPHCRTPFYLRGQIGVITGIAGGYRDPSLMAFHKPDLPMRLLYRVQFRHQDIWHANAGPDRIMADLYEHWLDPAPEETPDAP